MSTERREQPRVCFQVDATIQHDENKQEAQCSNISMSGMMLITQVPLTVGERKKVLIDQDYENDTLSIHADIEIVRVEEIPGKDGFYEVGVKFTNLEPGSSIDLLNLVRYHSGELGEGTEESNSDDLR